MPNTAPLAEGLTLVGIGGGVGALAFRVAQIWIEKRAGRPSSTKDAADLVTAAAAFQVALNDAAKGTVADLIANQERLEAEIENLKAENVECRAEGEALRQAARQLEQKLDSLMRQLRDPQATRPGGVLSGALIEMADGDVKVSHP
ncbi:hypothetical protein [Brevundimonas subvibrioides]|uniref:Chemotaxis protein n=1 Tax=Brevundimonas subvibrioides (strain ATCC 15264 / DSM 4735 / LMG 14903 / NBRC 16000 / CB 81) TaxID=633149 RepID=D9QFZ3_BRESC|nr:hypothetical protein [Brevundimonas subvibrioides]ADL00707.1 hypothetical protein Bresu_1395 [Brevundimonas subvibrioides ATCC 15264]